MAESYDAVVVGSGPNGLAAAVVLAKAGKSVLVLEAAATPGGGARTAELTLPGFAHDVCSAAHPLAVASPVFASFDLAQVGVEFIHPPLPFAHPLDGGRAGALSRSVDETAASLGVDGPAWRRHLLPFVERFEEFKHTLLSPVVRPPGSPLLMARFGFKALQSAVSFCEDSFEADEARALFAGCAAHSFAALEAPLTASFGFALAVTGHAVGWPILKGGSGALVKGLVTLLERHGGVLRCGQPVQSLAQLPPAKAIFFDTTPAQLAAIAGSALPPRFHRAAAAFRRGPGVFKLDYALSGPVPWAAEAPRRAGTVHLGGTLREVAASEAALSRGEISDRPYVLVAQQSLFDPSRAPAGQHTLWAYCHVPNGCTVDMTSRIEAQLERFAPGFSDLVLARVARGPAGFEAYNQNYAGGDISGGAVDGLQVVFRPRLAIDPYRTGNPKLFICSSSTPPGPGVHGMCGFWAAQSALRGALA